MKTRAWLITGVIAVAIGFAAYRMTASHGTSSDDMGDDTASVPTVVSVQVGTLKHMTLHRYVTGYGVIAAAPATQQQGAAAASVAAPVTGVVARVLVALGEHVRHGQELVELDSDTMTEAYAAAEAARQQRLYAEHDTSQRALQNARAQLALLRVTAPLAGTVVAMNVKPGAAVSATRPLLEIMDLDRLVVEAQIPEEDAPQLRVGQTVELQGTGAVATRLSYVSPTVDPADGTVTVWASIPAGSALRPGRYVSLRIVTATHPDSLVAPAASVVSDLSGHSVISVVHGDTAVRVPVRAGLREDGWVEVAGRRLRAGERIVTVGAYGLPERTAIRIVTPPAAPLPPAESGFAEPP